MIKCFLVEKTGRSEPRKCTCGRPDCTATYDLIEWRRVDTGETKMGYASDFGPGAMYWGSEYAYEGKFRDWDNDDGKHLIVITPGGGWDVDSRASNCTMREDRTHRCWIRHGEAPNITVDKNGVTCAAGAGSILCGDYHGFLQNGSLT